MTALAATIGTGNIAGVATAVVSGGPGAVFWIWCYGFFATAIKFSEAVLGMHFRQLGERPALRRAHALPARRAWACGGWAGSTRSSPGIAALTTTPFTQPNSIAVVLESQFGVPTLATGVVVAVLTWLVIVGGVRSIGRAAEKLSPAKVILYLAGGLLVIVLHADRLPATLRPHLPGGVLAPGGGGQRGRGGNDHGDPLRARPRDVRERGGVRDGRVRLRDGAQPAAGPAGPGRGDGGVHHLLPHLLDQRAQHPGDGRLALRPHRRRPRWPRPSTTRCRWRAGGWWPSARSCSGTRPSSAGRTTARCAWSTSSGPG